MPEVLQDTLTVEYSGETFQFKIPTIYDEMRIGVRMRDIRTTLVGPGMSSTDEGLDNVTLFFNRACATFDVLLKKASVRWVFSEGESGPVVNSANFPATKTDDVVGIYGGYQESLGTFRSGGHTDSTPAVSEAVAGQ